MLISLNALFPFLFFLFLQALFWSVWLCRVWWWGLTSNAERLALFPLIAQLYSVWCLNHERYQGQTSEVTSVYNKSGSNHFNIKITLISSCCLEGIAKGVGGGEEREKQHKNQLGNPFAFYAIVLSNTMKAKWLVLASFGVQRKRDG